MCDGEASPDCITLTTRSSTTPCTRLLADQVWAFQWWGAQTVPVVPWASLSGESCSCPPSCCPQERVPRRPGCPGSSPRSSRRLRRTRGTGGRHRGHSTGLTLSQSSLCLCPPPSEPVPLARLSRPCFTLSHIVQFGKITNIVQNGKFANIVQFGKVTHIVQFGEVTNIV